MLFVCIFFYECCEFEECCLIIVVLGEGIYIGFVFWMDGCCLRKSCRDYIIFGDWRLCGSFFFIYVLGYIFDLLF